MGLPENLNSTKLRHHTPELYKYLNSYSIILSASVRNKSRTVVNMTTKPSGSIKCGEFLHWMMRFSFFRMSLLHEVTIRFFQTVQIEVMSHVFELDDKPILSLNHSLWLHLNYRSWDCRYRDWGTGWMIQGSNSGRDKRHFLFSTTSRQALGLKQLPIQWILGVISWGKAAGT